MAEQTNILDLIESGVNPQDNGPLVPDPVSAYGDLASPVAPELDQQARVPALPGAQPPAAPVEPQQDAAPAEAPGAQAAGHADHPSMSIILQNINTYPDLIQHNVDPAICRVTADGVLRSVISLPDGSQTTTAVGVPIRAARNASTLFYVAYTDRAVWSPGQVNGVALTDPPRAMANDYPNFVVRSNDGHWGVLVTGRTICMQFAATHSCPRSNCKFLCI